MVLILALVALCSAAPRRLTYLRRVRLEPAREKARLKIPRGTPIDERGASEIAAALRARLIEEGYADPKAEASLLPAAVQQVDLHVSLDPGIRRSIGEVRFAGDVGESQEEVRGQLRTLRKGRPFSSAAAESDLARLRSWYYSHGYLDARAKLESVEHRHDKSFVSVRIDAGPRYAIRRSEVVDLDRGEQRAAGLAGDFRARDLCACLFEARTRAEKEGRIGFAARIVAGDAEGALVYLSARLSGGPPYRVGRIEFRGNHSISDAAVRRVFLLEEGALLDGVALRRSLARVNRLGLFEPLSASSVEIVREPGRNVANIRVTLEEQRRGRWSISGPVGPASVGGPLQASIASRLPAWGRGLFEASTYWATFSVTGWTKPLSKLLPFASSRSFAPLLFLERPYLPGQSWTSGFAVAPQIGWKAMGTGYAITQLHARTRNALDRPAQPELLATIEHNGRTGMLLLCEPEKSGWRWIRGAAGLAADLLLGARPY